MPAGPAGLEATVTVRDGLGHSRTLTRSSQIIDPVAFNVSTTHSFDAVLNTAEGYWHSEGRQLYLNDQPVRAMDADITALAHVEDRLLLAVAGVGLVQIDPEDDYRAISTLPLAGKVSRLVHNGKQMLVASADGLRLLAIQGAALKLQHHWTGFGQVCHLALLQDDFLAVTDQLAIRLDQNGNEVTRLEGGFRSGVTLSDKIILGRMDQTLLVTSPMLETKRTLVNVPVAAMEHYGDWVLGVNRKESQLLVVDTFHPESASVIGRLPLSWQGEVQALHNLGGKLATSQGQVLTPVSQASTRIYNASEQGDVVAGSIRQVSLAEGVLYSAADNYGAQIHVPSEHGGYQQQVVPAPGYVEKSTDVVAGQEGAYVLQPQQELSLIHI